MGSTGGGTRISQVNESELAVHNLSGRCLGNCPTEFCQTVTRGTRRMYRRESGK